MDFTLTLTPEPDREILTTTAAWRAWAANESLRARVIKASTYLGPWCSNCGKRGKNCRNRYACNVRVVNKHKVPAISGNEQAKRYNQHMAEVRAELDAALPQAA